MSPITAKTKLCMVIGYPVEHSLSPQMHNSGYEALNIADRFIYVGANVKVEHIEDFIKGVRAMNIRGISCTMPHKLHVIPYLDEIKDEANTIKAVNTIVNEQGKLIGYNTDWLGAVIPLEKITPITGKKVALLGAGGAARAVAYGITQRGGELAIFNRTREHAINLASTFGGSAYSLEEIEKVKDMDIIFNATSVGFHPHENESLVPQDFIKSNHIVFDAVYVPFETKLIKEAKEKGATIIHGTEMLLHQGLAQFQLYTSHSAPEEAMRNVLLENLLTNET